MTNLIDTIAGTLGVSYETVGKLLASVAIIVLLWLLRFLIIRVVASRTDDVRVRYSWRKTSTYVTVILALIVLGRVWFTGFAALTTYFGLLSAGIAIALRDPLVNLAGWVFLVWRRPFEVGDRIQIGEHRGDVIDLRIFQFTLMEIGNWVDADQSTGRVIHIPNGKVFTEMQANYSKGFRYIWNEVPVLITFESNWTKAKEILEQIGSQHAAHLTDAAARRVQEASKRFMIFYSKLTPTVYTSVKDCGVLLTIRYLCDPRDRRGTEQGIWEDILSEFGKTDDIDFAYPTVRRYDNRREGKPGTWPDTSGQP
jgi:small-conductance mechanosensitive channel